LGAEVTGYRDYSPGDDYRAVDWRICARHDELVVRQSQGEADQHTYLLVDCSRSMSLGRPSKFQAACKAAAALACVALSRREQVSVVGFSQEIVARSEHSASTGQMLRLLQFLDRLTPQGNTTDLVGAAKTFVQRSQRPGLAVVISDFYFRAGFRAGLDVLRRSGYQPRVVQIYEPQEPKGAPLGDVELLDVEQQTAQEVTITERDRAEYRRRYQEYRQALHQYCVGYRLGCVQIPSDLPEDDLLLRAIGIQSTARRLAAVRQ
jgi:uncharacterized protein (DUF58 family)